jgi:peptidyl-prolyl cis-trans isomerase SurA
MIKKINWLLAGVFCSLVLGNQIAYGKSEHVDKIIAVVNESVITQSDYDKRLNGIKQQFEASHQSLPKADELKQKILDGLIYTELQLQLAKRNNITASEADVDAAIASIAKNNKLTVAQLRQQIQQHEGISYQAFRAQIREQMTISRVEQNFLGKDINVTDQEVDAILKNPPKMAASPTEYHVADILIDLPEQPTADQTKAAKKLAAELQKQLRSSTDIAALVQKNNSDAQPVHNNDLGWRTIEAMPTLFAQPVAKMHAGEVAGPLAAPNGLHVIKVTEVHGAPAAVKLTHEQAQNIAYQKKMEERLKPWLEQLRAGAYIKINP